MQQKLSVSWGNPQMEIKLQMKGERMRGLVAVGMTKPCEFLKSQRNQRIISIINEKAETSLLFCGNFFFYFFTHCYISVPCWDCFIFWFSSNQKHDFQILSTLDSTKCLVFYTAKSNLYRKKDSWCIHLFKDGDV